MEDVVIDLDTSERTINNPEGLIRIAAAVVRQALADLTCSEQKHRTSARVYLRALGILRPDGSVDYHGHIPPVRPRRRPPQGKEPG